MFIRWPFYKTLTNVFIQLVWNINFANYCKPCILCCKSFNEVLNKWIMPNRQNITILSLFFCNKKIMKWKHVAVVVFFIYKNYKMKTCFCCAGIQQKHVFILWSASDKKSNNRNNKIPLLNFFSPPILM